MRFFADLHVHSRYSRATSKDIYPETLAAWARAKGLTVVGSGDITHPTWLEELRENMAARAKRAEPNRMAGFSVFLGTVEGADILN